MEALCILCSPSIPFKSSHQTRLSVISSNRSFPFRLPQITYSKGGPSEKISTKITHQPVVCSAYRYAPESTLRKVHTFFPCKNSSLNMIMIPRLTFCKNNQNLITPQEVQKKARKRGGDPRKKRKAKRKSKRSKKSTKVVSLVSSAKTGFSYSKRKSVESRDKLQLRKYDPVINEHVLFQE